MVTQLLPVPNSSLDGAAYDQVEQTFAVRFKKDGPIYKYKGVPADVYEAFSKAESPGAFVHKDIARGGYDFERIDPDQEDATP